MTRTSGTLNTIPSWITLWKVGDDAARLKRSLEKKGLSPKEIEK